ncbi:uncharacterized protein LOC113563980 isoform X2 [Drosophila erecta]|uniref:uncharacterized protein LOC113563980 isoform X2 n=1 Tax=Drosophila erecta TaxID=7220 RepID=UPI000F05140D|nr:uncharacterized protein LOC113563980 isoform X2 [Drosophila erecta]
MIVETKGDSISLSHHSFNDHLNNAEKALHRIEAYSLKLNSHIRGLKELLGTNRKLIAGLSYNEHSIISLLENKAKDKKMGTCKAANIREACWTQCESHIVPPKEEHIQDLVKVQRTSHTSFSHPGKELERQIGGQELIERMPSYSDLNEEIGFKVKCMLKLVEKMDFKTATIADVKIVRRRVLSAMSSCQKICAPEGVCSNLTFISKNPYLTTSISE